MSIASQIRPAVVTLLGLTVLTGLAYPLLVTGVAQVAFADEANGSLVVRRGKAVGSSLIGQSFDDPKFFWGRLSATPDANGKPLPYNAQSSYASNLGPTNPALTDVAQARLDALHAADPDAQGPVPVDLVTASGSGLDPHISPAAALYQVHRVAHARGLPDATVQDLVRAHVERPAVGFLGEPVVNVLALNLDLASVR